MELKNNLYDRLGSLGLISPEAYSTAWVAMVPEANDNKKPAWPQALEYLRAHQLEDGGWGEPHVYYAYERLISTLAVLCALATWQDPQDDGRIARGVAVLPKYVFDLAYEPNEPIGFELILPSLLERLAPFNLELPLQIWSPDIQKATEHKMLLIGNLEVDYEQPRTWWFSLEILPDEKLAQVHEAILNDHGSVAISTAATAAYLRALRLYGRDSNRAFRYLEHVIKLGGVGVCWPVDVFELTWVLDAYMRTNVDPHTKALAPLIRRLYEIWQTAPVGLAHSTVFPLNDVDDTAAGYNVLHWAGLRPSDKPLFDFWEHNHFSTYKDERNPSVSANVHALSALRHNLSDPYHKKIAIQVTDWLSQQMDEYGQLNDKWHVSPLYVTAHAVTALLGWDDTLAKRCIYYILEHQHEGGGWGSPYPNLEETAHAVLGLIPAWKAGLLKDVLPLKLAANYLRKHKTKWPTERLWIGKTLYQPIGVSLGSIDAAQNALMILTDVGWAQPKYHEALSLVNLNVRTGYNQI